MHSKEKGMGRRGRFNSVSIISFLLNASIFMILFTVLSKVLIIFIYYTLLYSILHLFSSNNQWLSGLER